MFENTSEEFKSKLIDTLIAMEENHAGDDEQIERCEIGQKLAAGIAAADARSHAFGDSDYYDGCFDAVGSCVLSEHKMQKSCKKAVIEADELKFLLVRR